VGKQSGQDSISVAVDVATNLMQIKGITAKFTLDELRDNISTDKCGCRGQSRRFNILESNQWNGKTKYLKVPVIHLSVFTPDIRTTLIKCKCSIIMYIKKLFYSVFDGLMCIRPFCDIFSVHFGVV